MRVETTVADLDNTKPLEQRRRVAHPEVAHARSAGQLKDSGRAAPPEHPARRADARAARRARCLSTDRRTWREQPPDALPGGAARGVSYCRGRLPWSRLASGARRQAAPARVELTLALLRPGQGGPGCGIFDLCSPLASLRIRPGGLPDERHRRRSGAGAFDVGARPCAPASAEL